MSTGTSHGLRRPWLIAAWPGMGSVGRIAAGFLAERLGAGLAAELDPRVYFDLGSGAIKDGLVQAGPVPASRLYACTHPAGKRDYLVFLGDAQPAGQGRRMCAELTGLALEHGAERVVTFAALATPVRPDAPPRVLGAASERKLLDELRAKDVQILAEGQITGLNGLLLDVASGRGLPGICLLGELPFYATAIANPKAASAVLHAFGRLAELELDLEPLRRHAAAAERLMLELLERLQRAAGVETAGEAPSPELEQHHEQSPAKEVLERIEELFRAAAADRARALELKAELDRHGLFQRYEDRFLDLFKSAG